MADPSSVSHNWKKVHFTSPQLCIACLGFIWGVGKQGYLCDSCNQTVHIKCKSKVVHPCAQEVIKNPEERGREKYPHPAHSLHLSRAVTQRKLLMTSRSVEDNEIKDTEINETNASGTPDASSSVPSAKIDILLHLTVRFLNLIDKKWEATEGPVRLVLYSSQSVRFIHSFIYSSYNLGKQEVQFLFCLDFSRQRISAQSPHPQRVEIWEDEY